MPTPTPRPSEALYDHLAKSNADRHSLAQRQTWVIQDWTRPGTLATPSIVQFGVSPTYDYDGGWTQLSGEPGSEWSAVFPAPPTAGNVMLAFVSYTNDEACGYPVNPSGWITIPGSEVQTAGGWCTSMAAYKIVVPDDGETYSWVTPADFATGNFYLCNGLAGIIEINLLGQSPVFNATSGTTDSSNSGPALTLTPDVYPAMCFASCTAFSFTTEASTGYGAYIFRVIGTDTSSFWPTQVPGYEAWETPSSSAIGHPVLAYGAETGVGIEAPPGTMSITGSAAPVITSGSVVYDNYATDEPYYHDVQTRVLVTTNGSR